MTWVSRGERRALIVFGALTLVALGVRLWQHRHPPITVEAGPTPPYAQWDALVSRARQLDLNEASAEQLERLPQIGPSTAAKIVEYRNAHGPFTSAEQLEAVPGIGPKTVESLRELLTVGPR